ncbi:MAG: hypothetical protein B6U87_02525 [Candidatus Aenigmarchaeota archaeon ex4484_52]|nr:MAG: hypothetical protein B6U87_02525 [Candidatus Aenigmarchaeota archaeon ex4484_52]
MKNTKINILLIFFIFTIFYFNTFAFAIVSLKVNLLNQNPDPVEPGKYVEVRFSIVNTGDENAENLMFEIDPQFPFSLEQGVNATKYLGTIIGGAKDNNGVILYYKLYVNKFAKLGTGDIKIKYRHNNYDWISKTFSVRIKSNQSLLSVQNIKTTPLKLKPGAICNINLTLKNNGDDDLKNVIVNLVPVRLISNAAVINYEELVFSPYEDSTEKIIKNIGIGQTKSIEFNLIASPDAELKPYKIPITINYQDRLGNAYSKEIYSGLIVQEDVDYSVRIEKEDLLIENSKNKIYLTISNKGKSKMNFVFVEIQESDEFEILSNPQIYLGNLDSDDEDSAEYELFFPEYNKTKQVNVSIKVSYRDAYNTKYEEQKQLSVNVNTKNDLLKYEQNKEKISSVFFVYIAVAIVVLIYFRFWKKKNDKKE